MHRSVVKKRLDALLVDKGIAENLKEARALIGVGRVLVNGCPGGKAGSRYAADCRIDLKEKQPYVSRGGKKLEAGLDWFAIAPDGLICADIGCSTGGFTDCLLQRGARKVYSVDVGYGVLDWKLRNDDRVVVLERVNARFLSREQIPEPIELAVIDASFISLDLLLKPVCSLFEDEATIIALVKPQFELPPSQVARGGVVRDSALHDRALVKVKQFASDAGLVCAGIVKSPVQGAKGNQEFLMHLRSTRNMVKNNT